MAAVCHFGFVYSIYWVKG